MGNTNEIQMVQPPRMARKCRYGENAYQQAELIDLGTDDPLATPRFKLVAGADMSYNNEADLDRALQTMTHIAMGWHTNFEVVPHIAVAVKHGNACGAAVDELPGTALRKTVAGDLEAIFGGVVMTNFVIDELLAKTLLQYKMKRGVKRLLDSVIAPGFTDDAISMLERKAGKCRLIENPWLEGRGACLIDHSTRHRSVRGGRLQQSPYTFVLDLNDPRLMVQGTLTYARKRDLVLAWAIGCTSNSNTITLVKRAMLIGNGVGQQHRGRACRLAIMIAKECGHDINGAVAYSDSFFPFIDGPKLLADEGIAAIFASSGSVRDDAVRGFCNAQGVTIAMLPDSICRGFANH